MRLRPGTGMSPRVGTRLRPLGVKRLPPNLFYAWIIYFRVHAHRAHVARGRGHGVARGSGCGRVFWIGYRVVGWVLKVLNVKRRNGGAS